MFQNIPHCPKISQIVQGHPKCPKCPTVDGRLYKVDSRRSTIEMLPNCWTEMSPKLKCYQNSNITKTKMSPLVVRTWSEYSEFDTALIALALFSSAFSSPFSRTFSSMFHFLVHSLFHSLGHSEYVSFSSGNFFFF